MTDNSYKVAGTVLANRRPSSMDVTIRIMVDNLTVEWLQTSDLGERGRHMTILVFSNLKLDFIILSHLADVGV